MIKVLFFAQVREQLDCERLDIEYDDSASTVSELTQSLSERGAHWRQVLAQDNLLTAVNHKVINSDITLIDGDEVAFYPPVTGG